ncbi:hypothetical protein ACIRD2_18800 [Streptomyces sp. NPDC093595]|jgi:hypothetical protein|uniref:hypothetical protein n=1 Tax=unclassified Streptomyces TaxID=2593676 RepID=UPI0037AB7BB0
MSDSPSPTSAADTERQLREALAALADDVHPAPSAYRAARGDWLRRERRRRVVLAALITVLFTLVTLVGLWVLNQVPSRPGVIFDDAPRTGQHQPANRGGAP